MAGVIEVHSPDEIAAHLRERAGELRAIADRLDDLAAVFMTAPRVDGGRETLSLTPADVGELRELLP